MQKHGYKDLAKIYDLVNNKKDYVKEVEFLKTLFTKHDVKTILDVGCGTGIHMSLLEELGFECTGIDLNQEMINIAKNRVKGHLFQSDMTSFNLSKKYDAIICMFAVFNHLLQLEDVINTISCFKNHLNRVGILLIDLYNPQSNSGKEDNVNNIKRKMNWIYDPITKIQKSVVIFNVKGKEIKDELFLRIYSIDEILEIIEKAGFSELKIYEGYKFKIANPTSKNLEVFACLN